MHEFVIEKILNQKIECSSFYKASKSIRVETYKAVNNTFTNVHVVSNNVRIETYKKSEDNFIIGNIPFSDRQRMADVHYMNGDINFIINLSLYAIKNIFKSADQSSELFFFTTIENPKLIKYVLISKYPDHHFDSPKIKSLKLISDDGSTLSTIYFNLNGQTVSEQNDDAIIIFMPGIEE